MHGMIYHYSSSNHNYSYAYLIHINLNFCMVIYFVGVLVHIDNRTLLSNYHYCYNFFKLIHLVVEFLSTVLDVHPH